MKAGFIREIGKRIIKISACLVIFWKVVFTWFFWLCQCGLPISYDLIKFKFLLTQTHFG